MAFSIFFETDCFVCLERSRAILQQPRRTSEPNTYCKCSLGLIGRFGIFRALRETFLNPLYSYVS
jgi:hypothetical protein